MTNQDAYKRGWLPRPVPTGKTNPTISISFEAVAWLYKQGELTPKGAVAHYLRLHPRQPLEKLDCTKVARQLGMPRTTCRRAIVDLKLERQP